MMKKNKLEEEYRIKYGHIEENSDYLEYIKNNYKIDDEFIESEIERINNIPWNEIMMTFFLIPKASPRPRYHKQFKHFFVRGAKDTKKHITDQLDDHNIIFTQVKYTLDVYLPTPIHSMRKNEIYLAEIGLIRPISNPDFDNLAKTYTDALQGSLLINDNIITCGMVSKYYSIKPRIVIKIEYQESFDSVFNERKMKKTIAFNTLIEDRKDCRKI